MTDLHSRACARCGIEKDTTTRWVACGASSCWQASGSSAGSWVRDDIVFWQLSLCQQCQVKGYVDFLSARIKRSIKFLKWSPIMFFGSLIGFFVLRALMNLLGARRMEDLHGLTFFVFGAGGILLVCFLFVSILGAPFHIVRLLISSKTLKTVKANAILPVGKLDDAFKGEGQRIVAAMETNNQDALHGSFNLPRFKERSEHPEFKDKRGAKYSRVNKSRDILLVATTKEAARNALPNQWKKVLEFTGEPGQGGK